MADKYGHLAIKQYLTSKNDLAMNHAVNKSVKSLFFRQNGLIFYPRTQTQSYAMIGLFIRQYSYAYKVKISQ